MRFSTVCMFIHCCSTVWNVLLHQMMMDCFPSIRKSFPASFLSQLTVCQAMKLALNRLGVNQFCVILFHCLQSFNIAVGCNRKGFIRFIKRGAPIIFQKLFFFVITAYNEYSHCRQHCRHHLPSHHLPLSPQLCHHHRYCGHCHLYLRSSSPNLFLLLMISVLMLTTEHSQCRLHIFWLSL